MSKTICGLLGMFKNVDRGRALRIAFGITALVLVMAGGAGAAKSINDNATGGECTSFGIWDAATMTCTMTTDLNEKINIYSNDVTLDGNGHTLTGNNTKKGIELSGRNGVIIKNLNVKQFQTGFYLDNSSNIYLTGINALSNNFGITLNSSHNNALISNNLSSNNMFGILLMNSSNNTLISNNVFNNSHIGIDLQSSNNNTLSANNVSNNIDAMGIQVLFSNNNMLSSNYVLNNDYGFFIVASSNNTLSKNNANFNRRGIEIEHSINISSNNNTLSGNNASSNRGPGILLFGSSNCTLKDNNVNSNNGAGIQLSSFNNSILNGNNANSNNGYGIYLSGSSNTLSGNNANSNKDEGIFLTFSRNNTLSGNNASNNRYGINLYFSSNNKMYHNILINNTNQAQDSNNTNSWDSGYPSGGNYWGDYTGIDLKSGSSQNNPASDGIGDTPYNIGGGAQDRYPFMILNGWNLPAKGDLNGNGVSSDAGDLVLMKRASIGEIPADSRYDLNKNGQNADAGDLVLMKRASIGEINL